MERPWSSRGSTTVGFLSGFGIASLIGAIVIWTFGAGGPDRPRIDLSRPTVVRQLQQLQRLETVMFGLDKIVAGGKESRYLPQFLVGDRLLLIVYGEVMAGVDVGRIGGADVIVSDRTIRMTLPEPEIFATRIDNERTRVYSRDTGLFTRVDPNLESDVRKEAERQVRQAALDGGILEVARQNARGTMTSLLHGLGFEQVDVR
jgi:hypothetical protein